MISRIINKIKGSGKKEPLVKETRKKQKMTNKQTKPTENEEINYCDNPYCLLQDCDGEHSK